MCNAFARNPLKPVEIATSEIRPQCIAGYPESTADGASLIHTETKGPLLLTWIN